MATDRRPTLAEAMFSSLLSREQKDREEAQAKQKAEQRSVPMRDVRYMAGLWKLREGGER